MTLSDIGSPLLIVVIGTTVVLHDRKAFAVVGVPATVAQQPTVFITPVMVVVNPTQKPSFFVPRSVVACIHIRTDVIVPLIGAVTYDTVLIRSEASTSWLLPM
jgi:hypothetical protein